MKRNKMLCGILTVLATCLASGCGFMQAKNDTVLEPQGATAFERALDYEEQQEFDLATREYEAALVEDPTDSRSWVNLGLIHQREGRTRHAVACWQKAIRANPNDAYAYNLLGNMWKENGEYSKAVAYYRRAIQADPDYADPHWNMAVACRHLNREREAAEQYAAFIGVADMSDREDIAKAKTFLAELGGTDIIPNPRPATEMTDLAEAEPSEDEETSSDLILRGELAAILAGEDMPAAEVNTETATEADTEAVPEADTEAVPEADTEAVPEANTEAVPECAVEVIIDSAPDVEAPAPDEMEEVPEEDAAEPEGLTDDEKEKAAAELEHAVRECAQQVRAEE